MFSDSTRNLIRNCFVISGFMGLIPVFEIMSLEEDDEDAIQADCMPNDCPACCCR